MLTLPPDLHLLSSHSFGTFSISFEQLNSPSKTIKSFKPVFMGSRQNPSFSMSQKLKYDIRASLWHYYVYLSDMVSLPLQFVDQIGNTFFSTFHYRLKPKNSIMKPQIITDQLIQNSSQQLVIHQQSEPIGSVIINVQMNFDFQIHHAISDLINFNEFLVFQGISPIQSQNQIPREPPQSIIFEGTFQPKKPQEKRISEIFQNIGYSQIRQKTPRKDNFDESQASKMMEDDIDKLVAQMISKPYDSSRYQEGPSQQIKIQTTTNFHPPPQIPQTIKPYETQRLSKPPINRKNSREKSQQLSAKKSQRKSVEKVSQPPQNSFINLKIYQLLHGGESENLGCYLLKIFINNNEEEYFSIQGIPEGQNIIFNQNIKLKNINNLRFLRFVILNDYSEVEGEGIYNLSRLYTVPNQKGIFTVNIVNKQERPESIKISTTKLKQVIPIHRSLRLQAQLIEKVQFVQIYLKMNQFSLPFSLIRYKIPFTKETIQFSSPEHFNIFPHNHTTDKIIVEVWNKDKIIGISQLSLKQTKSTNSAVINASLQPIYLHDGSIEIKDIFQQTKKVGKFNLTLCYGNVKQIHGLLNTQSPKKPKPRVEVSLNDQLGILVREKKQQISTQVQVQIQPQQIHNQSLTSANQFLNQPSITIQNTPTEVEQQVVKQTIIVKKPTTTITERVGERLYQYVLPFVQHIPKLKELCRPHLLFNFINMDVLHSIMRDIGLSQYDIGNLFRQIVKPQTTTDMININVLYDMFTSATIDQNIKPSLISDTMLVRGAMILLYQPQKTRQKMLLQPQLEFKEMKQLYEIIDTKITLHQYETLIKFMENMNLSQCLKIKEDLISQLDATMMKEMKKGMYQDDILNQLYGQYSQASNSFMETQLTIKPVQATMPSYYSTHFSTQPPAKLSPMKKYSYRISVEGIANVRQSSQCLFDESMDQTYVRVIIDQPVFQELIMHNDGKKQIEISQKMEEAEGKVELCANKNVIAIAPFLLMLGIKSVYALKTKQNEFCGLLSLQLQ